MSFIGLSHIFLSTNPAMNARINHKTEESAIKAERLLRTLEFPDSIAYQCGE